MRTVSEFTPTSFDHPIGHFPAMEDKQEWIVAPVSHTRDSLALEESNYRSAMREFDKLDPDYNDHEEHSFGHWGPGWYEIIILRPASKCWETAVEIEGALADYPILDDEDFSELEWEEAQTAWGYTDLRERIKLCAEEGLSIFTARHDSIPQGDSGRIYEQMIG
jgi:hypothetical protein